MAKNKDFGGLFIFAIALILLGVLFSPVLSSQYNLGYLSLALILAGALILILKLVEKK